MPMSCPAMGLKLVLPTMLQVFNVYISPCVVLFFILQCGEFIWPLLNWILAYCTGLLLARRVLKILELDDEYEGNVEVLIVVPWSWNFPLSYSSRMMLNFLSSFSSCQATGEDYSVEAAGTRRPFRALLDVGLVRTTTGNRVFGVLKVCLLRFLVICVPFVYQKHSP